jgi:hypothetical protein
MRSHLAVRSLLLGPFSIRSFSKFYSFSMRQPLANDGFCSTKNTP